MTVNYEMIQAAMYRAIGAQTKMSRSGESVIFARPTCGRHDLSDSLMGAIAQAREAGLDLSAVTPDDVATFHVWQNSVTEPRRLGKAKILITRRHLIECGNKTVPANTVVLLDGYGDEVDHEIVLLEKYWDDDATNFIGRRGAISHKPDVAKIQQAIAVLRARTPKMAHVPVQDNACALAKQ